MITVTVSDANGQAIPNAMIDIVGRSGAVTGRDGRADLADLGTGLVAARHPDFVAERSTVQSAGGAWRTDNPLFSGDGVSRLNIRLGRLSPVPVAQLTEAAVSALITAKRTPNAALLFNPPRFPKLRAYLRHWNDTREVHVARHPLLPTQPSLSPGWGRFAQDKPTVDLPALGRFFQLAWGNPPSAPPQLVTVWSPNLANPEPLDAVDFVVFYTPSTSAISAVFPFGLDPALPPNQPSLDLGVKYMANEYFFVHQLLARRNRSVIVMPIGKRGAYGPSATGEGMLRLLREITLFLHREGRTSSAGNLRLDSVPDLLAGSSARDRWIPPSVPGPLPRVGAVAVSGFSYGIAPVKQLMEQWGTKERRDLWGVPPIEPGALATWQRAFREVWDLDGSHGNTGGLSRFLSQLSSWFLADPARVARAYHSEVTGWITPVTSMPGIVRADPIRLERSTHAGSSSVSATEYAGTRWSVVNLANAYVSGGPDTEAPHLSDPHHAVPKVGFSHATALTRVGRA